MFDIKGTLWALAAVLLLWIWMMNGCQSRRERRHEFWQQRQDEWHQRRDDRKGDGKDWHWGDRWRDRQFGRDRNHDQELIDGTAAGVDLVGDHDTAGDL